MATKTRNEIDDYLAGVVNPAAKRTLTALRTQLRKLLPTATETLSYSMPAYRMENGKVAAGFAFFGKNCGFYPHSGNIVPRLGPLLDGFKASKGGVTFPPERPLPAALVKALVAARLEELGLGAAPVKERRRTAPAGAAAARSRSSPRKGRAGGASRG